MAEIAPFRALHYNPAKIADLRKVVTQPYDKISPDMQAAYYEASPYNFVRLILRKKDEVGAGESVYREAARELQSWICQKIMVSDSQPAIYPYAQEYAVPGRSESRKRRWGFVALCGLEDYSAGVVHRHEETLSGPKVDRLELLKATRCSFGQIFFLYSDPQAAVESALREVSSAIPWQQVTDEYATTHSVWRASEPRLVEQVVEWMRPKKLVIADGHHRYETALAYSRQCRAESAADRRAQYVMATFVPLESDGLAILPTHRVVHSLQAFDWNQFCEGVKQFFGLEELSLAGAPAENAVSIREALECAGREQPAIIAYGGKGRAVMLHLRADNALDRTLAGVPETLRRLDLVLLHEVVLERVMSIDRQAVREQKHLRYIRNLEEAMKEVSEDRAQVAFLMNPTPIRAVCDNAFAGFVLPQKSTDFYPKLLSGLTVYWMDHPGGQP